MDTYDLVLEYVIKLVDLPPEPIAIIKSDTHAAAKLGAPKGTILAKTKSTIPMK